MNYISAEGTIVIQHRDVSSLTISRRRVYEDVRKDHNIYAPQLLHTLQLNDCVVALLKAGYNVSAGYRGCLYLKGGQQLVPDARLSAGLYSGRLPIAFIRERSGTPSSEQAKAEREEIRRQIIRCVPDVHRRNSGIIMACICETKRVMHVARQEVESFARQYQIKFQFLEALEEDVIVADATPDLPDFVRDLYSPTEFFLEYERSAITPGAIRDKLMPYFRVARSGYECSVIFICETRAAAEIFQEWHQRLQRELGVQFLLITSTYKEVAAGNQFETCWNRNGKPVKLL